MKIYSWNVNGIRAITKKGLIDWVKKEDPDILCLQEVKAFEEQMPKELAYLKDNYNYTWHGGSRPGYSGVATFSKEKALSTKNHFKESVLFGDEGRVIETKFKNFTVLNLYFPNGGSKANGEERLSYKLEFYDHFLSYMNKLRESGEKIVACGDFNVAHKEIDIARPKANENSIGFLRIERDQLDKIVENKYIDSFRLIHTKKKDKYTWWSYRAGARGNNVGWRIDYIFISPDLKKRVKNMEQLDTVMGSDHCPLVLELDIKS